MPIGKGGRTLKYNRGKVPRKPVRRPIRRARGGSVPRGRTMRRRR